jgi:hypothetical protein
MMEALNRLTDQAKELRNAVAALALSVDQLDRRTTRSERITTAVVLILMIVLVLAVAVGITLAQQFAINDRLETAIQREAQTRQQVLCPLYRLLVGSYNPESRPPGPARDEYLRTSKVILDSYPRLDCTNPVTPGATVPR